MSSPATESAILDRLFDARQTVADEIDRLNGTLDEIDAVIDRFGGEGAGPSGGSRPARTGSRAARSSRSSRRASSTSSVDGTASTPGGKSIREHVLELLGSEDRDFGLAEVIDSVHAAGIQAHDDAVRSITIKLMKDGQVERVGRGQYRLSGSARSEADSAGAASDSGDSDGDGAADDYTPPLNLGEDWNS